MRVSLTGITIVEFGILEAIRGLQKSDLRVELSSNSELQ